MKHPVRVLTRGDDYGSCSSANRAILECVQGGLLRNVSVLACGPAFDPVPLTKLHDIDVGLHLCLSSEWDEAKWGLCLPWGRLLRLSMGMAGSRLPPCTCMRGGLPLMRR